MRAEPWLSKLNTDDLDILMDSISAAQSKLHRVHPNEREFRRELIDLLDDMYASWREAFLRKQLAGAVSRGRRPPKKDK